MKPTATDFPDPGMLDQLKELSGADPFQKFKIRMRNGRTYTISRAADIEFTPFGSPKIRESQRLSPEQILSPGQSNVKAGQWAILNIDAIDEIIL
jgi:hypothetical protein